jgi:RNA polymerase sigma factor (sigma-70 family)
MAMIRPAPRPERALLANGSWDDLLDFLDPDRRAKQGSDRDRAAEAGYFEVVRKLICFFAGRGCPEAEDLAVETVLRVAGKCGTLDTSGYPDRHPYFYAVARNVLHEWRRNSLRESARREELRRELARLTASDPLAWSRKEAVQGCLDACLAHLTGRARRLILAYYQPERCSRIEWHRRLAEEFGKSLNALRIEVHRIRNELRRCVAECARPGPLRFSEQ